MAQEVSGESQGKGAIRRSLVAVVLTILLIGGLSFLWGRAYIDGTKILLATRPIDPFDPLRGQYIDIRYEISQMPIIAGAEVNSPVYVLLSPDQEGIFRLVGAIQDQPVSGSFLRGYVERIDGDQMFVKYGIEQYFFERQAKFSTDRIVVEALVDSSGQARISQLLRDGKPVVMEYPLSSRSENQPPAFPSR